MSKYAWQITHFNAGEFSPLMNGRIDYEARQVACKRLLNCYPVIQGPVTKRGGTRFIGEVKDSSKYTRLAEFEFSIDQSYILEFGEKYIRFYRNYKAVYDTKKVDNVDTQVLLEVETPYLEADLADLYFCQNNDLLYIAHKNYPLRKLTRMTQTNFVLAEVNIIDGAYSPVHTGDITFTPSATTGNITVTSSVDSFAATDIGRFIRIEHPNGAGVKIGWGVITAFNNTKSVAVTVKENFQNTAASKAWRMGAFSKTDGYPSCVCFFESRLVLANGQRIAFSKTGNYDNFSPSDFDGKVLAAHGFLVEIAADNKAHNVQWLCNEDVLFVGAVGADFVVSSNTLQDALTAANARARRISTYGSEHIRPIKIDDSTVFVQRMGRKIRAFAYNSDINNYQGVNVTGSANHITKSGLCDVALTQEPVPIIWYVRKDGRLVGCTYDREQGIAAWHQHIIGGKFNGDHSVVESIASIPSQDMSRDDLYMIVKRTIKGQMKRYIEFMDEGIDDEAETPIGSFFVDCGRKYSFSEPTNILTGLEHLEGETVNICADGFSLPELVVKNGQINLDDTDSTQNEFYKEFSVGFGFSAILEPMPIHTGDNNGTSEGKIKRIADVTLRFHNTIGCHIGANDKQEDYVPFKYFIEAFDPNKLFTGDKTFPMPGRISKNTNIVIQHHFPLPFTLEAIFPVVTVNSL